MQTGPAPGVPEVASAQTPADRHSTPTPPAYLLRNAPSEAREDATPGVPGDATAETTGDDAPNADGQADEQMRMPAVMALLEAGGVQEPPANLPLIVEALLYAAEQPPTVSQLAQATNVSRDAIEEALDSLDAAAAERGLRLQRSGNSVRLVTAAEAAPFIRKLLGLERPNKLSKAALETLAIVAYQQPVTRGTIERVRGVTCDAPMSTLRLRELIASIGQSDAPGHPQLWATTPAFLDHFGLHDLSELPPLPGLPAPAQQGALDLAADASSDGAAEEAAEDEEEGTAAAAPSDEADTEEADTGSPVPSAAPRTLVPAAPTAEIDFGGLAAAGGD